MIRRWKRAKAVLVLGIVPALALAALVPTLGQALGWWPLASTREPAGEVRLGRAAPCPAAATGRQAVSDVIAARQLLLGHDAAEAARYLDRADRLLGPLEHGASTAASDRITLYSAFTLPGAAPAVSRLQRERFGAVADCDGRHRVLNALRRSRLPFVYRYLDLTVAATADQVRRSLTALRQHDDALAASILDDLEQGLRETVVTGDGSAAADTGRRQMPSGSPPANPQGAKPARTGNEGAHA